MGKMSAAAWIGHAATEAVRLGEKGRRKSPFGRTDSAEPSFRSGQTGDPAKQPRSRYQARPALIFAAFALTGCATTQRYAPVYCLTRAQLEELKRQAPPKVHDQLTGNADRDTQILAGNLIRVRAFGDGLLQVLGGCVDPKS
jgi:hypothetical protein